MPYLVIARKYRPLTFNNVVGQEAIVTTLKNAIKYNKVAHAYLFAGPRGVGKTSMARILSKSLNCETGISESPCNKCDNCISISNGNDVDVLEIDGASNRGIDEIRNIRQNVNYTPSRSPHKIYIIDEVHMLTKEAFNALLKTLEEPPSHVKFIFATTSVDKLPETVQSRCQRFDFKDISIKDIENQIALICEKENIKTEKGVLYLIAKFARGGLRDALSVLDQLIAFSDEKITINDVHTALGTINEELMFELTDSILNNNLKKSITTLEKVFNEGKGVTEFIDQTILYFRDLLMALIFSKETKKNESLSENQIKILNNHEELSIDLLMYMIQILSEVRKKAKDDRHKRILLEVSIIKLARTDKIRAIDELVERLENIEKSLSSLFSSRSKNFPDILNEENTTKDQNESLPYTNDTLPVEEKRIETKNCGQGENNPDHIKTVADFKEIEKNNDNVNNDKDSIWKNILSRLQSKRKTLWGVMQEGSPIEYKNKKITIEFPGDFHFHKERLEKPDIKSQVEEIVESVVGEKVKLEFILSKEKVKKEMPKDTNGDNQGMYENTPQIEGKSISNNISVDDKSIINNDCIQKAVKIFDGNIVEVRRINK